MPYKVTYSKELRHHGIKGQKWGERNGPPYPLGAGDHSASEKKAGWRKSLDKSGNKGYNKGGGTHGSSITDEQKKALAAGAAAVAGTLAVYGAYKAGLLNADTIAAGRRLTSAALDTIGNDTAPEPLALPGPVRGKIRRLSEPESLEESLKRANPYRSIGGRDNRNCCTHAAVAGFLRQHGYDVSLVPTGGEMQNQNGVIERCFKKVKTLDGSAMKFGKSMKDASEMLVRRYGNNAEGVCGVQWYGGHGGHTFNWKIENGKVTFIDFKQGTIGSQLDHYWNNIDPQGSLQLARLDNAEINLEGLTGIVE